MVSQQRLESMSARAAGLLGMNVHLEVHMLIRTLA